MKKIEENEKNEIKSKKILDNKLKKIWIIWRSFKEIF